MTTYTTGNPLGSTAAKDLYDNAENFDNGMNSTSPAFFDRFGKRRETWAGMQELVQSFLLASGYVFLADYAAGVTITGRNQYVLRGGLAYVVANATALPYTTTGVWASEQSNFKLLNDALLRQDLADDTDTGKGAELIGYSGTTVFAKLEAQSTINAAVQAAIDDINSENAIFLDDYLAVGETFYDAALAAAWIDVVASGRPLNLGPGVKNFASPVDLTFPSRGATTKGAGLGITKLQFPNASVGEVQLYLHSAADWYDLVLSDFSVNSAHDGTLARIGRFDFADPLNTANFTNIGFFNAGVAPRTNTVALELNYMVNSVLSNVRANCYADGAGTNYGRALVCNQVEFCVFNSGSFGNASFGISFLTGFSFGLVFNAIDVENVNYGVYNGTANSGRHTFNGGQFSLWTQYMFGAPNGLAGVRFHAINPNLSSSTNVISAGEGQGVLIEGLPYSVSTPSVPATTVAVRNTFGRTVEVAIWGGAVTVVTINGFGIGLPGGTFTLRPWDTISMTYSSPPSWNWREIE